MDDIRIKNVDFTVKETNFYRTVYWKVGPLLFNQENSTHCPNMLHSAQHLTQSKQLAYCNMNYQCNILLILSNIGVNKLKKIFWEMKIDFVKEKNVKGKIILREKWFGGKTDKDLGGNWIEGEKRRRSWFWGEKLI